MYGFCLVKLNMFSVWTDRNNVFNIYLLWKQNSCCSFTYLTSAVVSNSCKSRLCLGTFQFWWWLSTGNTVEEGTAARTVSSTLGCHWIAQNSHIRCTVQLSDSSDVSSYPRVAFEGLMAAVSLMCSHPVVSSTPERIQEQVPTLLKSHALNEFLHQLLLLSR